MPSVRQYEAIRFAGFQSGLNKSADSSRLEDTEVPESLNMRLGGRGEMQLRSGYIRHDLNLTQPTGWLYPFRSDIPSDHLIAVNTNTKSIFEDQLDGIFNDSGHDAPNDDTLQDFGVGFAAANGNLYISSKQASLVKKFDGSIWSTTTSVPDAKHLLYRHNRMFAINTVDNPSRIAFSAFLDPEAFAPEDWIDVDPDDGYQINAATVFGDDLVVFKDKSIHKLAGRTPESFALYEVDTHRGCVSPRSLAQIRGRQIFFDRDTGIWAFNGASFELLSENINDYILAGQDYDNAYRASAYVGVDRLYMSIPWQGGEFRTFVWFADTGGWSEYDTGFEDATFYLGNRYQGHPGADGVYVADPLSNEFPPFYVGTPIPGSFRTPWVRIGQAGVKARIRRLEMTIKGEVSTNFTVNMYRDYNPDDVYVTRDFVGGAVPYTVTIDTEERVIASDGWGNRLHAVQFEILTDDTPFQLNDMTVFYTGGIDVRGER